VSGCEKRWVQIWTYSVRKISVSSLVSQLEMVARLGEETVAWLQGHFWVTQYEIEEGWLDPSILNNLCKGTSRPQLRH